MAGATARATLPQTLHQETGKTDEEWNRKQKHKGRIQLVQPLKELKKLAPHVVVPVSRLLGVGRIPRLRSNEPTSINSMSALVLVV
jgi:hypothetical protein